ncbi:hypothetical protein N7326_04775 [Corynebacterium sp. ES2794-CONJ1]|nr:MULTISPECIES: hypothetical protein [unclassified Corynebacterium]MCS4489951.1 hypothetical protein [Corynebacterium sp. ES2775-CONJ]MCS4491686.1 hypothetical protein [Corynebacterium sp. ES2715-CONJ3]MCS4531791.1 hypothetical protein [Corynebacterium sp. ES2730-CONJ]MCU9519187.1 hypothetical protein [Corynebacterium sp. ES2794-CONJ1]
MCRNSQPNLDGHQGSTPTLDIARKTLFSAGFYDKVGEEYLG